MSQIKGVEVNSVICDTFKFRKQISIKDYKLKCVISFLIKRESNDNGEPQYEINLPALIISFLKCFSFLLYHKLERKSNISLPFKKKSPSRLRGGRASRARRACEGVGGGISFSKYI